MDECHPARGAWLWHCHEVNSCLKCRPWGRVPLEPCRLPGTGLGEERDSPWCDFAPVPGQNGLHCVL